MTDRDPITPSMASAGPLGRCEKTSPADYIWLSYSLFFFIEPVVRNTRDFWLRSLLVYLPFLAVYILFVQARRFRNQVALLGAMAALGLVGFSFNAGASSLITLATAFLPFVIEDVATILVCFAGTAAAVTVVGVAVHHSWINIGIAYFLIAVVGSSNIFIGQRKRANARLSLAHEEIERLAALAERERIARDMHDVLGHTLSVIVLKSELAGRLLARSPDPGTAVARQEIADVEATARKALAEVRETIGGYRSRGLPTEVDHARRTLATAGVTLTADVPPHLRLSATEESVLSLAVREAVTNVLRHARATRCDLRFTLTAAGGHTLTLVDDGKGTGIPPHREGNGLRGMRERVEALGGQVSLTSSVSGTTLSLHLPTSSALPGSEAASPRSLSISAADPTRAQDDPRLAPTPDLLAR